MFSSYCIPFVLKRNKHKWNRFILPWFAPKHVGNIYHVRENESKTLGLFFIGTFSAGFNKKTTRIR